MNAKPRVKCPECEASCKRLIGTGAGVIFKGSGFYETDYKKSHSKSHAKTESKSETKSETKSESKSESKPATSSPAKD